MDILSWILTFALSSGQLIRLPYLSGGITALDIIVFLLSVIGLLKLKFKFKKPPFLKSALFFILIALFSLKLTPLHLSFNEYFFAVSYTARFSFYLLLGWVIFSGAFASLKNNIPKIFILSGFIIAVLGVIQLAVFPDLMFLSAEGWDPHYFRLVSTFLDPNFTGAFLVLSLISISHLRGGNEATPRVLYIIFALIFVALLMTFSRSSYGMFVISGLTFSFIKKSKKYVLITLILFAFLLFGFQIYNRLVAEPRNISRDQSASFRLNTWQQGFTIFGRNPVLGVGFNAYRYTLREYQLGDEEFLKSHGSSGNDSSLLFVASTTGIAGLLAYLYFLFSILRSNRQILLPAVLGLIAHSLFSNSLFYPPVLGWLIFMSAGPKK